MQEVAILAQIAMDCERLLARCFESYYALSESSASGILEGGQASSEIPAPALRPAVQLCSKILTTPTNSSPKSLVQEEALLCQLTPHRPSAMLVGPNWSCTYIAASNGPERARLNIQ